MNYNYHTHTPWCSHATGEPEAYVQRAIEHGVTHMGFSDHVPLQYPDGYQSGWRVQAENARTYVDQIRALRDKYKEQISLKVGFEMEYYAEHFARMLADAIDYGAEYLILGQHFPAGDFERVITRPCRQPSESEEDLIRYVDGLTAAMQTGLFSYVAHPDLFCFVGDEAIYRREMRRVCEASLAYDVPLEINMLGIRDGRRYPCDTFWKVAGEVGAPVTFGFDAHDVDAAYDAASIPVAKAMVERFSLHYIGRPTLKPLVR